jgi:2-hydroxycyclohexanecarboxyl-CoA dehydrogenase
MAAANATPLAGRRALVTGGASGIGAAIARRMAADGAIVVIADLQGDAAAQLAQEIGATGVQLDVTDFDRVHSVVSEHGPFHILVNSAGVDQHAFFTQTSPADWHRLLAVNLESVLNTTHAVLPAMQEAGYGRIVNVASEAGRLGSRGGAVYAAAKGGVIAFTRSIARENGRKGITANVVAPGPIDTPLLRKAVAQAGDKIMEAMTGATLAGRLGTPDEVAAAVVFLAGESAGFVTGEVLGVSGGMGCGA